jgi:hypothetical protein
MERLNEMPTMLATNPIVIQVVGRRQTVCTCLSERRDRCTAVLPCPRLTTRLGKDREGAIHLASGRSRMVAFHCAVGIHSAADERLLAPAIRVRHVEALPLGFRFRLSMRWELLPPSQGGARGQRQVTGLGSVVEGKDKALP